MEYRGLGTTGLKISRLGFGGIPLQRLSRADAKSLLAAASDAGVNVIDTARGYSVSEELIGYSLKGRRRDWIVASKSMARTKRAILNDIHTSLKNIGTDYLDVYQIHNVRTENEWQQVTADDGALAGVRTAAEAGLVRHIGITSHSADMMAGAIESGHFVTMMLAYNIVEEDKKPIFKLAHERGLGTLAMKPLAGGVIADSQKALRYLVADDTVDCLLVGMDSPAQVIENAEALGAGPLTDDEENELREMAASLGQDFCRRCGYCQPCPEGIDISTVFLLESYYDRYELKGWAIDRYAGLPVQASLCAKCGECIQKCPYGLQIPEKLARAAGKLGA